MSDIADPREFGLGDIPVADDYYEMHSLRVDALNVLAGRRPVRLQREFDARSLHWVSPAKNQGRCGCCWAFASTGTFESRLLKDAAKLARGLAEQQQVSCNTSMSGCCGGSGTSLLFFQNHKPLTEKDVPYAEIGTRCPTQRTRQCSQLAGTPLPFLLSGFYTVQKTVDAMKTALLLHGPYYFRFDVYDDFYDYWGSASPRTPYVHRTGSKLGGHAVLLIGWSDAISAWLLKNSWGPNVGPARDGTFWVAYTGHAADLNVQGFNMATLTRA